MMDDILSQGVAELGLALPAGAAESFLRYTAYLAEQNSVMNLTSIEGGVNVARLHFLDCMAPLCAAQLENASVIDVGAGAGFPGVVLKLTEPGIKLTMLDSQKKRVDFLERLCARLELTSGVECLHMRAEEAGAHMRESFDFAVSRAVAELRVLCELALPFVRVGGTLLAMKGPDPEQELESAQNAIAALGGATGGVFPYTIPGTDIRHTVVLVKKIEKTPEKYPRRFARIQKKPL